MRVKRNNTVAVRVFTGRDLIEKLYSEGWEVEQREYGLKDTAKSIYKIFKNRGKSIIKGAKNLVKSEDKIRQTLSEEMENASRNRLSKKNKTLVNNIEARSTLLEDAGKKYDINYSKTLGDSDYHISRKDFIKDIKNNPNLTDSQRKDEIKKLTNKEYIFLKEGPESGKNPEVLAHEIGHIETSKLSNPMDAYTKWRSKGREASKFREYTGGSEGKDPKIANEDFSGIRGYLKLKRRNRGVNNVLMEEENASKNAKESLKNFIIREN